MVVMGWCWVEVVGGWLIGYADLDEERERVRETEMRKKRELTGDRENSIKY